MLYYYDNVTASAQKLRVGGTHKTRTQVHLRIFNNFDAYLLAPSKNDLH